MGCASTRPDPSDGPITRLVVCPGDSNQSEPLVIEGDDLKSVLNGLRRCDATHEGWVEQPITIIQGTKCRKGKLIWLSTFLPGAEIVIPYPRFWNRKYEVLKLSDTGSQMLVELMRAQVPLPGDTSSPSDK